MSFAATQPRSKLNGRPPVVLVGFAEAYAAIETAWSLQAAGFKVVAFRRAHRRPALRRVRGVEIHTVPAPELDAKMTVKAVALLVQTLDPSALLPLDDHAVWVCSQLDPGHVPVAGPTGRAAAYALDKRLQLDAAERAGLPVPRTKLVDDPREAAPIESPVIVKPAFALREVNGKLVRPTGVICADEAELAAAAARSWHGPQLVQPLIRGVGRGLFGHAGEQGVSGWSSHQRIRMLNPQGSASSACRSSGVDTQLVGPSEAFLAAAGWRGMFMLEFLQDDQGTHWFMELNGRAWGSMALARRRGFEYPAWTVRAALEPEFEPPVPGRAPDLTCRNLGLEIVHLIFVARGPQSDAPVEWPRLSDAMREVCWPRRGRRLYNWKPSQPQVLFADTVGTLGTYTRKMVRRGT